MVSELHGLFAMVETGLLDELSVIDSLVYHASLATAHGGCSRVALCLSC